MAAAVATRAAVQEEVVCQREIAGRKRQRRGNKISTAVEGEARKWPHYAAFAEVAAAMLPAETMAAIWAAEEAATPAGAEPSV